MSLLGTFKSCTFLLEKIPTFLPYPMRLCLIPAGFSSLVSNPPLYSVDQTWRPCCSSCATVSQPSACSLLAVPLAQNAPLPPLHLFLRSQLKNAFTLDPSPQRRSAPPCPILYSGLHISELSIGSTYHGFKITH